ncbi:Doublecortin domain-containing protein 2 [Merluccius polli]|uniref:Doublecortin domain-containing protein 2 n=1 Tax=Merluccius polli TaxID=89951 RepID=A0AA47NB52_MERPO|nr:Doublecortin domain-containing protein 2 [Merluccius polli]
MGSSNHNHHSTTTTTRASISTSSKPNFLSQPVVKNIFMYRNGDPHYEARRIVINQRRVGDLESLLREVTGGVQAPFGAVRNIYTPRGGHRVESLDHLRSGEQYVAAGREKFKKLDYMHIGSRKKKMQLSPTLPVSAKLMPQRRIMVSARFLKPIRDPCPIFVAANGDLLNPVIRLLIQQRMQCPLDKILEMITEKMSLRVLGGVRSDPVSAAFFLNEHITASRWFISRGYPLINFILTSS